MTELTWTPYINGAKAVHGERTYYIGKFHDDIHVSYSDATSPTRKERGHKVIDLTHVQWGGIADLAEAKSIAQQHADNN